MWSQWLVKLLTRMTSWPGRSRRLPRTVTVLPGGRRDHVELPIVGRRESFSV